MVEWKRPVTTFREKKAVRTMEKQARAGRNSHENRRI